MQPNLIRRRPAPDLLRAVVAPESVAHPQRSLATPAAFASNSDQAPGRLFRQPNFVYFASDFAPADPTSAAASVTPDDLMFGRLWGLNNAGDGGGRDDADIDAPEAWAEFGAGDGSVVVAVLDTGVDWRWRPRSRAACQRHTGTIAPPT